MAVDFDVLPVPDVVFVAQLAWCWLWCLAVTQRGLVNLHLTLLIISLSAWPTYIYCLVLLCSKTGNRWVVKCEMLTFQQNIQGISETLWNPDFCSIRFHVKHWIALLIIRSLYCAKHFMREGKVSLVGIENKSILCHWFFHSFFCTMVTVS